MRKAIEGSNVLVTGGAGFIGSHLVDELLKHNAKSVVIIDNMFLGKVENLAKALAQGAFLYKEDAENYSSLEAVIENHYIEVVFNCATKALNYSFIDPRDAFTTNVSVVGNLLEMQRLGKFKTLCHFSSSEVYGTALYEPMDEAHPYNPTTTYAGGKAAADLMVRTYVNMFDIDAFIVRPFNNYGPRQNAEPPLAGIIPITCKRILEGKAPELHGTGKQSRDFIHVLDTVDAVLKLYDVIAPGQEVNISAQGTISMKEIIELICEFIDYQGDIIEKVRRGADVDCHNATNEVLMRMIDFKPRNFKQGLADTVEWYKKNL